MQVMTIGEFKEFLEANSYDKTAILLNNELLNIEECFSEVQEFEDYLSEVKVKVFNKSNTYSDDLLEWEEEIQEGESIFILGVEAVPGGEFYVFSPKIL